MVNKHSLPYFPKTRIFLQLSSFTTKKSIIINHPWIGKYLPPIGPMKKHTDPGMVDLYGKCICEPFVNIPFPWILHLLSR